MIRSMTGFGSAAGAIGGAVLSIELRTVNHRFFTPSIKLPGALARWEPDVRELLRQRISRGHVTLFGRLDHDGGQGAAIDAARFASYARQLKELQAAHDLEAVDVGTILRMPDVLASGLREEDDATAGPELLRTAGDALGALVAMREAEGQRLSAVLAQRLATVRGALARIAARAPQRLVEQRDRLRQAVAELAGGVAVDEQRLALEVAVLADRLDVNEEVDRMAAHVEAFAETLHERGDEPVGKRLGFLLQEMQREMNTIGSKATDIAMQHDVIATKEELERMREQVENIE
jgi:uncharacterized protein (TIGR00255 family)